MTAVQEKRATQAFSDGIMLEADKSILSKIKAFDIKNVGIFSGAQVDPDGLASADTMRQLIERNGGRATVFYRGTFNRPQNKTMRQVLSLALKPIEEFNPEEYTCIISVDGPASVCPVKPHFIIDHHEQTEPALEGNDVRPIGSCSAILWQYAMEDHYNFKTEDGAKLATALAIGILTDTQVGAAQSSSILDFEALGYCLTHKDLNSYLEIQNYPVPSYYQEYESIGWSNKAGEGPVIVSCLGDLPVQRSGVISYCAEKFFRVEGKTTSIVFAIVDGNIHASIRTQHDADEFMKTVFGNGGGKKGAGAAIVELPAVLKDLPPELRQQLANSIGAAITHKALQATGDGVIADKKDATH